MSMVLRRQIKANLLLLLALYVVYTVHRNKFEGLDELYIASRSLHLNLYYEDELAPNLYYEDGLAP